MLLSIPNVLLDELRGDLCANLLGSSRAVHCDAHEEAWEISDLRLSHRRHSRHFDGFLQSRNQIFHRDVIDVLWVQSKLTDEGREARAAQDLLLHAGKALEDVRSIH